MNHRVFVCAQGVVSLVLVASLGCAGGSEMNGGATEPGGPHGGTDSREAVATIEGKSGISMTGTAVFTSDGDEVELSVQVAGVPPGPHAIHIHEKGDCSAPDAKSAGGHWNPSMEAHGRWSHEPFHLGDIGNFTVGGDGKGSISLETSRWAIGTGASNDVVGRSVVVHAGADDFMSQPDGAAGTRIGCGVIRPR